MTSLPSKLAHFLPPLSGKKLTLDMSVRQIECELLGTGWRGAECGSLRESRVEFAMQTRSYSNHRFKLKELVSLLIM